MDNRPIGFFDSGLGGLTSIPNLFANLPNERVIYFGDTARTPYGSKAVSTITSPPIRATNCFVSESPSPVPSIVVFLSCSRRSNLLNILLKDW